MIDTSSSYHHYADKIAFGKNRSDQEYREKSDKSTYQRRCA